MSGQVMIYMSGDDARLNATINRQIAQQEKFLAKLKETTAGSKKLSEEEVAALKKQQEEELKYQKLQERAKKIIADNATAHETYAAKVREAVEMKQRGVLVGENYNRHIEQLKSELRDASGATDKLRAAEAAESKSKAEAEAITKKYQSTLAKTKAEMASIQKAYDEGRISLETYTSAKRKLMSETKAVPEWATSLGTVASGYLSVNAAIQTVTQAIKEQRDLQNLSLDANQRLAVAQEEAVKNFVGMKPEEMQKALALPEQIAKDTGFTDVPTLMKSVTGGYSTVSDMTRVEDAVRTVAPLTRLDPSQTEEATIGVLNVSEIGKVTGAQAAGLLLSAGQQSPVNDPRKVNESLTPVLAAAVQMFPEQDKKQVMQEAAAVWATFSSQTGDKRGEASATAAITFMSKVDQLFDSLKSPDNKANKAIQDEITKLEKSLVVTEKEAQGIKVAQANVEKAAIALSKSSPESNEYKKLQLAKETAEVELRSKVTKSTLTEQEKQRLDTLKQERQAIQSVVDPQTFSGRTKLIQENKALRDRLFAESFGEEKFKAPIQGMAQKGSEAATGFAERSQNITFNEQLYSDAVKNVATASESLQLAQAGVSGEAARNNAILANKSAAATAQIENTMRTALQENRTGGIMQGTGQLIGERVNAIVDANAFNSNDPVAAAKAAEYRIARRLDDLLFGQTSLSDNEVRSVQNLQNALESLAKTVEAVMSTMTAAQQAQAKQAVQGIRDESRNAAARLQAARGAAQ